MKKHFGVFLIAQIAFILASAGRAAADTAMLTGADNMSDPKSIRVRLRMTAPCENSAFTLSEPPRLVVDLKSADSNIVGTSQEFTDPVLKSIRIGKPATDTVRVVFDLSFLIPYKIEPAEDGKDVIVTLTRRVETTSRRTELFPGIVYTAKTDMTDEGPLAIHILDVNLNKPGIALSVVIGEDRIGGREKLSALVKRTGAAIGINGGYFTMDSGLPIDLLIVEGKVLLLPARYRGFFGIDSKGKPVIMRPNTELSIGFSDQKSHYVHRLNWPPGKNEIAIFTPEYGKTTKTHPARYEVVIRNNVVTAVSGGNSKIPEDGFVLSADAANKGFIDTIAMGAKAAVKVASYPDIKDIVYGFSAGPILIKDGILQNALVEDFAVTSGIVARMNPRTAVGRTNNNHLLFVVVEGRSTRSVGMSLEKLGGLMLSLGSVDAINFDGGGSSEIVVKDKILNQLAPEGERPLANALMIYVKR